MVELGLHYGEGPVYLKDIAKAEEISEKYLSQIIIPLKSSGLVQSFRGAKGGYMLSRPSEEITVKDIYESLEGGFNLVDCIGCQQVCSRSAVCVTRGLWEKLGHNIAIMLEDVVLKDLVDECRIKNSSTVMYNI